MKYSVKQKVWEIKINKFSKPRSTYSTRQDGITINELEILGVSKYKVVLNNDWFTTVTNDSAEGYKKDRSYNTYLNDVSVNIRTNNHILDDGVFISLYSTVKPTDKLLNKMVAKASLEINKQYGFLFGGIVDELYDMVSLAEKEIKTEENKNKL